MSIIGTVTRFVTAHTMCSVLIHGSAYPAPWSANVPISASGIAITDTTIPIYRMMVAIVSIGIYYYIYFTSSIICYATVCLYEKCGVYTRVVLCMKKRTSAAGSTGTKGVHSSVQPRKSRYVCMVKRSSAGLGLFSRDSVVKGDFIIEYYGTVLTTDEADQRKGKYLFEVSSTKVVDGSPRYNMARYINHSCRPNCETDIVRGRIYIYARRAIQAGEELSYDYGKEYFNDFIKPYGCRCPKCSGR